MGVYGSTYLLRSIACLAVGLYEPHVINFINATPQFYEVTNLGLYLIYDLLPIGLLYYYHHANFRTFADEDGEA